MLLKEDDKFKIFLKIYEKKIHKIYEKNQILWLKNINMMAIRCL